ncbi:DUF2865 domain-containing protein, partial [uncultured Hyphomicrobium sp.]
MADFRISGFKRRLGGATAGRTAAAVIAALVLGGAVAVPALGQSWWPFGGNEPSNKPRQAPVPSEPMYQDPATVPPRGAPGAGPAGGSPICLELEQRLVQEGQRGSDNRNLLPMVQTELRQVEQTYRESQKQLDRADCYEYFLFSKTLRRTRRCVDLANQADTARQRIEDLEVQVRQLEGSPGRSYQDEIVRELARNNCGASYQQQARRQSGGGVSNFWEDGESSDYRGGGGSGFGSLPYATYRTVCVRLCDGYYFPVSFSTLPNHFQRDEEVCQSKCAAPAQLFYHQNPGAGMEQAVDARTNQPYTSLKTAFRYRKEYINGCSCKMTEYQPAPGEVSHTPAGNAQG